MQKEGWRNRLGIRPVLAAGVFVMILLMLIFRMPITALAAGGLSLSTEYPGISISSGDNLNISLKLKNSSGADMDADIAVTSLPEGFEAYIQGGSYRVSRVYVENGGESEVTLHVSVPDELSEGSYRISLKAASGAASDVLDIVMEAKEQKGGEGSFTSEYPSQEGTSDTSFSFSTDLINNGLKTRSYSLSASAPSGWTVRFTPASDSTQIAGIEVEPGSTQGINVSVTPPGTVEAGEYDISLSAVSAEETLSTDLKVIITGTYGLELSTPTGLLSFDAHAGEEKNVVLSITNTGNVDLQEVSLNSTLPSDWTVSYDLGEEGSENIISSIPAGSTVEVTATVTPGQDAVTGDYSAVFTVSNDEADDSAEFRVSVKTSTLWGIVALLLIAAVCGGVWYMFRKYGRR